MTIQDFGAHLFGRIVLFAVIMTAVLVCSYEYQQATTLPHWCDRPDTILMDKEC